MSWVLIAMSAHLFWAFVSIGDKYIVSKRVKNPYVYMVWLVLLSLLAIGIIPFINFIIPDLSIFLWLILASVGHLFGSLFYIKATQIEDISRINILWGLLPVFSLIIAWFTLEEVLNFYQLIAFVFLTISGFLASIHIGIIKIRFSLKSFNLMVMATLLFAIYTVIFRYIITVSMDFLNAFIWLHILTAIWACPLFLIDKFRKDFIKETKVIKNGHLVWIIILINIFHQDFINKKLKYQLLCTSTTNPHQY